jgi:hypothetical protein
MFWYAQMKKSRAMNDGIVSKKINDEYNQL